MTCSECGDKPKNTAKDFPKAVVEITNPETLVLLRKVVISATIPEASDPPAIGKYRNVILQYEDTGNIYIYSSDGIPTAIESNVPQEVLDRIADLETTDGVLQQEIDDLKNSPDVVDIAPTYAALQAYDTSHLGDNDVVRVLADETHDGQSTYYRWNAATSSWAYIGAVGDYYTKGQVDTLLTGKQDTLTAGSNITIENGVISATDTTYTAGANVQISPENVISATDTTYSAFAGTDGTTAGEAGLVPAPATTDAGKFLKADGTWDDAGGSGVTELTSADYNWPTDNPTSVALWLLPSGMYTAASGTVIRANSSSTIGDVAQGCFIVGYGVGSTEIIRVSAPVGNPTVYLTATSNGAAMTLNGYKGGKIITEGNLVQGTGTSTTDVMSQNAVTSMVFADPASKTKIQIDGTASLGAYFPVAIGSGTYTLGSNQIAIGRDAQAGGNNNFLNSIAVGYSANANGGSYRVAIGGNTVVNNNYSVALGNNATTSRVGEVNIGTGNYSYGYNGTAYRVLGGVHDPVDDHDAATKSYVDTAVAGAGTTYTAGYGLDLNGTEFSVDTSAIQEALTAGDNITIEDESGALVINASVPTVNDSTITVTNNGTTKGSFTTNQSSAGSVALDYPVITMTTTDPGEGSALAENNYIGVYGGDPIIMDYSTSEVNTGAKWIDGSLIYKKTVSVGTMPNASTKSVAHGITNLGRVVKYEGIVNATSTSYSLLPHVATNKLYDVQVSIGTTEINISSSNDRSSMTDGYITIYYTKSS